MKMTKKQSNNKPSILFRIFSGALSRNTSLAQISKTIEESMQSGISFLSVLRVMTIGANKAVQPTIINVLKMLLPTTLPMAISALPLRAEDTLTVSSGGRSAECNDGKSDHDGRDAKTLGYRGGTVC